VMHAEGLVHRDIKPANIMRCLDGAQAGAKADDAAYTYKLIDFGTALGVDERVARAAMMTIGTNRGDGAGTAPYMSPEMFKVFAPSSLG
jgi:serine/threonine protein kinase